MLTGDLRISNGDAYVRGISLKSNMNQAKQLIGYCPQFDGLLDDLTGFQTLAIMALLRGVRCRHISNSITQLANDLGFMKHLEKPVRNLSGGNKRKLSTAMALIGNPIVVYLGNCSDADNSILFVNNFCFKLKFQFFIFNENCHLFEIQSDEPTTGMDPASKRKVWNVVAKARNSGKSIVLTSHSMEECEALCTRLAIMVNGQFKCIGSTQHLKDTFSKGVLLTIIVRKNDKMR